MGGIQIQIIVWSTLGLYVSANDDWLEVSCRVANDWTDYFNNWFWSMDDCAYGYVRQSDGSCTPARPPVQGCPVSHPVFPGTGVKILIERDASKNDELPLSRAYRSYLLYGLQSGKGQWIFEWQREIDSLLVNDLLTGSVTVLRGDGDVRVFRKNGVSWRASGTADTPDRVVEKQRVQDKWGYWRDKEIVTWRYTVGVTGAVEIYDAKGRLQSVQASGRRPTTLSYNKAGQLASVTAPSGRALRFDYDARGNVASVIAPDGGITK
ncbi:RHS repeat domain-containing protein [Ralstonia soli]|uniref:RHS repeat protein n=1 Tax=Ralstonia soli TaxID=2953896 RepID=A0ABT1ANM9_9RALS|nr:hypothetical protein [Ralstonia soli]MCO5400028.1 hypothetical protein [Ralstonia soli]